ncbi:hypothetical protein V8F33_005096 [Rhypophila sp. PSN 637]
MLTFCLLDKDHHKKRQTTKKTKTTKMGITQGDVGTWFGVGLGVAGIVLAIVLFLLDRRRAKMKIDDLEKRVARAEREVFEYRAWIAGLVAANDDAGKAVGTLVSGVTRRVASGPSAAVH